VAASAGGGKKNGKENFVIKGNVEREGRKDLKMFGFGFLEARNGEGAEGNQDCAGLRCKKN